MNHMQLSVKALSEADKFHTSYGNLKEGFYLILVRAVVYALLSIADAIEDAGRKLR